MPPAPIRPSVEMDQIRSIQYLRGLAALMVAILHASYALGQMGPAALPVFVQGQAGVDVFFVISGFIMATIARVRPLPPLAFFLRRLARIAPPYWVATSVMVLAIAVLPGAFQSSRLEMDHVLASYLFVPWDHPVSTLKPVLHVGWTLNLEMLFYGIFAACLPLPERWRLAAVTGLLAALVLGGWLLEPEGALARLWTRPILLEFAFGMGLAVLWARGVRVPVALAWACVVLGLAGLLWSGEEALRWLRLGIPASLLLFGALMLERAGQVRRSHLGLWLGEISYALYLCHYFAIGAVRVVWPRERVGELAWDLGFMAVALGLALAGSMVFYRVVEAPLLRWSRARLGRPRRLRLRLPAGAPGPVRLTER